MSESTTNIYNSETFDPSKLTFGLAKKNKTGTSENIPINYDGNRLYLSTKQLRAPFGASNNAKLVAEKGGVIKWTCQLEVDSDKALQKKLEKFDEMMIETAIGSKEFYKSWVGGKEPNKAVAESKYTRIVKDPDPKEDGTKYPPFIRVQLPTKKNSSDEDEFSFDVYDKDRKLLSGLTPNSQDGSKYIGNAIPPKSKVVSLIYPMGWKTGATGFGVTWRVEQVRVYPGINIPKGICLLNDADDPDDSGDENNVTLPPPPKKADKKVKPDPVDDDDNDSVEAHGGDDSDDSKAVEVDDDSDDSSEEKAPTPPPSKKDKKSKKTK